MADFDFWNLVKSDQVREQGDPALVGVDPRYIGNLQLIEHYGWLHFTFLNRPVTVW